MTGRRVVIAENDLSVEAGYRDLGLLYARRVLAALGPSTRTTMPDSAAAQHAAEFGHALTFGCCSEGARRPYNRSEIESSLWTSGKAV